MSGRNLILIAIVLGLSAAFFIARFLNIGISGVNTSPVIVATQDIHPGNPINSNQIKIVNWPSQIIQKNFLNDSKFVINRISRQTIYSGQPIVDFMLVSPNSKGGLSSMIADGKRAITVRVNEVIAVAGFVFPGSYVDVLVNIKNANGNYFSKTVLSKVKILAVAQETEANTKKPKIVNAVTLELTPKESELLDVARSSGNLSLSLRNEFDQSTEISSGTNFNELLTIGKSQNSEKDKISISNYTTTSDNTNKVEIYKGNFKSEN